MQCPICSSDMKQRQGAKGMFWGCSRYPTCKGTVNIEGAGEKKKEEKRWNGKSPDERAEIGAIAIVKSKLEGGHYNFATLTPKAINEAIWEDFVWFRERMR